MEPSTPFAYWRCRWPDPEAPPGEALWFLYEVDYGSDACTRTVEIFPDGRITRNSLQLEQRRGDDCPSLFDTSLSDGFHGPHLERITAAAFEEAWDRGVDTPFWFP